MEIRLKYVVEDVDRHGNVRLYYRRKGCAKIRLPAPIGSPAFLAAYKAADSVSKDATSHPTAKASVIKADSIRWLTVQYYQSAMFKELDTRTQHVRRLVLERFCQHENNAEKPYRLLRAVHLKRHRDTMADRPHAANGMLKALRHLYSFAIEDERCDHNPAADVKYLKTKNPDGFHTWATEEIEQFRTRHPVGTKARLALELMLETGQRRSDIVLFGKQHIRDGSLFFRQQKNRKKSPIDLIIPVTHELQQIINASPCGDLTFLVTEFGKPFTANGFGNWFRDRCDEAGLPQCSAHGLRKSATVDLAHADCTPHEIMAVTGHKTLKEVTRYTEKANKEKLAKSAMKKKSREHN